MWGIAAKMKISEIECFLLNSEIDYKIINNDDRDILGYCPLNEIKDESIVWSKNANNLVLTELEKYKGIVMMVEYDTIIEQANIPIIFVKDVRKSYFRVIDYFFSNHDPLKKKPCITESAIVKTNSIGSNVMIGQLSFVDSEVEIGNNVKIGNNVTIQGKVIIGNDTIIESGARIGVCGFGYYLDDEGKATFISHLGGVKIGREVFIGANTTIARGCLGDTIIEDFVKIDNLCHIAHNVIIKKKAIIVAQVMLGGSVTIEENAYIAPGAIVNTSVCVEKDAFVGLGSVVNKNVPANKIVYGVPSRVIRDRKNEYKGNET